MGERTADYIYVLKKHVTCPELHIKVEKTDGPETKSLEHHHILKEGILPNT